jgi:hypothetical protein
MNGTPVEVIPAPGVGKSIVVEAVLFRMTRTATAFTGGGAINLKYSDGATLVSGAIAAAVVTTGGAGTEIAASPGAAAPTRENLAVQITNATAAFAAGTGTAEVTVFYRLFG